MARRVLECADELYRVMCAIANGEYAIVELLPKNHDTWDDREYALKFVADGINRHTDNMTEWLHELRDALKTRGWERKE